MTPIIGQLHVFEVQRLRLPLKNRFRICIEKNTYAAKQRKEDTNEGDCPRRRPFQKGLSRVVNRLFEFVSEFHFVAHRLGELEQEV